MPTRKWREYRPQGWRRGFGQPRHRRGAAGAADSPPPAVSLSVATLASETLPLLALTFITDNSLVAAVRQGGAGRGAVLVRAALHWSPPTFSSSLVRTGWLMLL